MSKKFDFLVFIGRFQPLHNGHLTVINRALELSDHLFVLVGSANRPRSLRNPFSFDERAQMILLSTHCDPRITILPLNDFAYGDDVWVANTQRIVNDAILARIPGNTKTTTLHGIMDAKIGLIGLSKDHTSYYLKLFPDWGSIDVPQHKILSATDIRENLLFSGRFPRDHRGTDLPEGTVVIINSLIKNGTEYQELLAEYKFVQGFKEKWKHSPYPPIFTTVDAVVVQSGHILLVKRRAMPGKGKLALPGGYINENEHLQAAMLRELREETSLKVPEPVLKGNISKVKVFDDPHRSDRGRIITHAYLITLPPHLWLPEVRGGSDAKNAAWYPIGTLKPTEMFEDHWFIIQNMVGIN